MIRKFVISSFIALALTGIAGAQTGQAQAQATKAEAVIEKVYKLDLLNQILPLMLTKEQLKGLLPVIEEVRENVRKSEKKEAEMLAALEPKLDKALKDALEKGEIPKREEVTEAYATLLAMRQARNLIAEMNTATVLEAFTKNTNAGQRKVAANSLDPRQYGMDKKRDEVPEADRLRLFVREILLHPFTYDILRKLSIG